MKKSEAFPVLHFFRSDGIVETQSDSERRPQVCTAWTVTKPCEHSFQLSGSSLARLPLVGFEL